MSILKRCRPIAVTLAALLSLGLLASPAFAAPANWSSIEIRWIVGTGGTPAVLVAGDLPPSTPLPAEVQLAVPKGTRISWAGEIVGTDPSKDPTVQYTTQSADSYDRIDFTLTKAKRGQIEYDGSPMLTTNGDQKTVAMSWTSPVDAPQVDLAVQPPSGAKVGDAGGATPSSSGGGVYVKSFKGVKAGQRLDLRFSYTGGTAAAAPQPQAQPGQAGGAPAAAPGTAGTDGLVPVVVLALLVGGTFFFLKRAGTRSATAEPAPAPKPAAKPAPRVAKVEEDGGAFDSADDDHDCGDSCACGTEKKPAAKKPAAKKPAAKKPTAETAAAKKTAGAASKTAAAKPKTTSRKKPPAA